MTTARRTSLTVMVGLACVLCLFAGAFWLKGYRMYVIHTGSMQPTLELGTLVITKPAADGYEPGDVITFRHSNTATDVVTHRVVSIDATGITTKGDANATPDPWTIRPDQVQGVRWLTVPRAGYLLVFLKQPAGVGALVAALLGLILLWGLFFPAQVVQAVRRPTSHRAPRRRAVATVSSAAPTPTTRLRAFAEFGYEDSPTAVLNRSDLDALRQLLDR